jgi:hypothetical protein
MRFSFGGVRDNKLGFTIRPLSGQLHSTEGQRKKWPSPKACRVMATSVFPDGLFVVAGPNQTREKRAMQGDAQASR